MYLHSQCSKLILLHTRSDSSVFKLMKGHRAVERTSKRDMFFCLKKIQKAPRRSEHPPVKEKLSKRLGGIIGCKHKTSSWHLNRFPEGSDPGSTV